MIATGFFGKIPARGDFVADGLPPDFTAALDAWWQAMLPHSHSVLGAAWSDIWMEAPVWCFALSPGCCGANATLGLWMPSVDRVGRLFPLTLATVAPRWEAVGGDGFLAEAEQAGRSALEDATEPERLAARLRTASGRAAVPLARPAPGCTRWWTDGSPLVAPVTRELRGMPGATDFVAMLVDAPPA